MTWVVTIVLWNNCGVGLYVSGVGLYVSGVKYNIDLRISETKNLNDMILIEQILEILIMMVAMCSGTFMRQRYGSWVYKWLCEWGC